jgi:uncharacterized protein YeaO (DUF488 family)
MTIYTDSLSNLKRYKTDFYKIAVTPTLSYQFQNKIDAWFNEVSPSRSLFEALEQKKISWNDFEKSYCKEMSNAYAKSKIKWIKDYSKNRDIVLLCFENESDPNCHRHLLKKLIEDYD